MNYLVELHAQVCTVSEGLLGRTMNAVLGELVDEAVKCFSQVKEFGTGGLLTVRGFVSFSWKSLKTRMRYRSGRYGINVHAKISRLLRARDSGRKTSRQSMHATDYKFIFTIGCGRRLQRLISNHAESIVRRKKGLCCTISMFQTKQLEASG
jgi:hypothetical protein